jgi:dTMP kinase
MNQEKGKIILIEGTDCSGKQTQTELLLKRLNDEGIPCKLMSFPRYNTPTGRIIGQCYLGKPHLSKEGSWFGDADKVDPQTASLFYAADRRMAKKEILEIINSGINLILDRYYTSNMSHQAGKFTDPEKRRKMIKWLELLELKFLQLPKEDICVFLHMPTTVAHHLNQLRGEEADSHEKNLGHLMRAESTCLELAKRYNWKTISCAPDKTKESLKTIEEISEEVYGVVKEALENDNPK